ncbi:MAG: hypothetical protein PHY14_03790 [Candidatus Gracilibacteria bacterium]|nr:hypothetical protein [Candidatus Gracilibacteria bacterium]
MDNLPLIHNSTGERIFQTNDVLFLGQFFSQLEEMFDVERLMFYRDVGVSIVFMKGFRITRASLLEG